MKKKSKAAAEPTLVFYKKVEWEQMAFRRRREEIMVAVSVLLLCVLTIFGWAAVGIGVMCGALHALYKEKKKATITKCVKRDAEQMVIPEQIDGYTVTGIGDAENEYNGYIYAKTFIIPDSVNTIKDNVLKSSSYGKCVIIGKKNSESEHYAKKKF